MKMTRLISIVLCIALLASALWGCGDDGSAPSGGGMPDFFGGNNDAAQDSSQTHGGTADPPHGAAAGTDDPAGGTDTPDSGDDPPVGDQPQPEPEPEPEPIDPNSNILPDFAAFLCRSASTHKDFADTGRQFQWNGSHPIEVYESTKNELIALLLEPQYQLSLRESKQNPHYSGTVVTDIFFDYRGTNPDIAPVTDEYGENTFHLRLRVTPYEDYGYFKINVVYAKGFVFAQPEWTVSRDITPGGDMRWLNPLDESAPPESTDSLLLPCLEDFLYRECTRTADHYAYGDMYGREEQFQNMPLAAYETVREEVVELLCKPLYQLRLLESRENAHYDLTAYDYYFEYTGTNENITPITDKYEQKYTFDVMVRFLPNEETDKFQLYLFYNQNFEPAVTSYHTTRDVSRGGDGSQLPADHQPSDSGDSQWREKCSSCHGSGKCTHCGGDGEVKKFQAGLGWVELDCTLCNRGKCRHCNGKGWD